MESPHSANEMRRTFDEIPPAWKLDPHGNVHRPRGYPGRFRRFTRRALSDQAISISWCRKVSPAEWNVHRFSLSGYKLLQLFRRCPVSVSPAITVRRIRYYRGANSPPLCAVELDGKDIMGIVMFNKPSTSNACTLYVIVTIDEFAFES